jgi:hypothetical protein
VPLLFECGLTATDVEPDCRYPQEPKSERIRGNRKTRAEADFTFPMQVKEAEHGSAPMNSAVIARKLSADDWADDKWVEQPDRASKPQAPSDIRVPERESGDDWMDDRWVEELVQGPEASGFSDTSLSMNRSQCEQIRRHTVPRQQSAAKLSLTSLHSDEHEALPGRQVVLRGRWGLSRQWRPIASYARDL